MNTYNHLFSPVKVGNTTIKNRLFMPPISTNLADKGYVTDELVKHYEARAKGGVGLIVTEVTTVEPTYIYLPGDMSIHDDSLYPRLEEAYRCSTSIRCENSSTAVSSSLYGIPYSRYTTSNCPF